MYIYNYTCIYRTCTLVYTRVAYYTSEGDLTYSSVPVDRDGSWLEHHGDKDFAWHMGWHSPACEYVRIMVRV